MGLLSVASLQQSALESEGWLGVFSLTDLLKILYAVCMHVVGDVKKILVHGWKVSCMYRWYSIAVGCVRAVLQVRTS
jgi:hypothetical protein